MEQQFVRSHYPEAEGMVLRNGVKLISGAQWSYDYRAYTALADVNGALCLVEVTIREDGRKP